MADRIPGWKSLYYDTLYTDHDERLIGYGWPPSDPEYSQNHPGMGQEQLERVTITIDAKGVIKESQ